MGSITTWARLEPHGRDENFEAGLEMRVHDPLWLLARQWQFGEFQGEDTGSPVWARTSGVERPLGLYLPGRVEGHGRDDVQDYSSDVPLEYLVENERLLAADVLRANRRLAVEAGHHFLRLLGTTLATDHHSRLLEAYRVEALSLLARQELDAESLAFLDLVVGRVLDGARLLSEVGNRAPEDAAQRLGFDQDDLAAVGKAITEWLKWCSRMVGEVGPNRARSAWEPQRMEYACAVATAGEHAGSQKVMGARAHPGGHLDWYAFDAMPAARLERDLHGRSQPFALATLPTNLSFRGMPANRSWEFEDAQVRFGAMEAGPTDLGRILLVEFLVQYGNDFFVLPSEFNTGTLIDIDQLVVTNTFGEVTNVSPFVEQEWRLFTLSTDDGSRPTGSSLFLPPVLGQHLAGVPIEDVELLRDEMANVAWAIERAVSSPSGSVINRHEAYQARRQREIGISPPPQGKLVYRLDTWASTRPDFWIPLLPEQATPGQAVTHLACYDPEGHSRGVLLSEKEGGYWLYISDEEIPRGGVHITRRQQYTRWYKGQIHTWIGREKRPGRGSSSSGLRFDALEVAP